MLSSSTRDAPTAPDDQLSLVIGRGGQNVRLAAKLTGYKITVTSSAGKVQSSATGLEEYEIDTFTGLNAETREQLIQHKLTTVMDLSRFKVKWMAFELTPDQEKILSDKVATYEVEQANEPEFKRKPRPMQDDQAAE